jgi:hypothetical protein
VSRLGTAVAAVREGKTTTAVLTLVKSVPERHVPTGASTAKVGTAISQRWAGRRYKILQIGWHASCAGPRQLSLA